MPIFSFSKKKERYPAEMRAFWYWHILPDISLSG